MDNSTANNELLRRQTLDLLRFPLALMVLSAHVWLPYIPGQPASADNLPVFTIFNNLIDGFLRNQSVPIYFFISGYVFFYGVNMSRATYVRKLKNRIKTLFIPYIVWNALFVLVTVAVYSLPAIIPSLRDYMISGNSHLNDFSLHNTLSYFINSEPLIITSESPVITCPANGPLWFLRELMTVVLCTPVIYVVLKRWGGKVVLALATTWFILRFNDSDLKWLIYTDQLLSALFFFSWGAYMSIKGKDMLTEFGRWFKASAILYPALSLLYVAAIYINPEACVVIKPFRIIAGLLFAYNISAWLLKTGRCTLSPFLASASFFIYVSHAVVIPYILRIVLHALHPTSDAKAIATFVITTVLTALILLGTFGLLRRYAPRLLKVVAGRK